MTVVYGIGIMLALLAGGTIGLLVTEARYHLVVARHRQYEQEVAEDRELRVAAQVRLQRYLSAGSGNRKTTAP
ncbi:MAG TPA: hypothetical protein VGG75_07975 [Trebonia sp.]|jgi:hypothetical protein